MIFRNKELLRGLCWIVATVIILSAFGFAESAMSGVWIAITGSVITLTYLCVEWHRYRRLRGLSEALDALLHGGDPLSISEYEEGELSILANQIQKMTLRLQETAEVIKKDKEYLADSLADISHQLRTPLTAMNLTVTMLRSTDLTEARRMELTGELRTLLLRTDWLVESLLKLSKLDAGTVKLAKDRVAVSDLISRAADPIAIPMDVRNQQLIIRCGQERFVGDLTWSAEALGNILKNCMEHTPEGGTITVAAEETALYTHITVEDTGEGFSPQDLPHLFERFYKGSNASETSYGIGLALARTVIAAQSGSVQAINGENGAKFVIKFYKQII